MADTARVQTGDGATDALVEFVDRTTYEALPAPVVAEAKRLVLDVIGNVIGGVQSTLGAMTVAFMRSGGGQGRVPVLGTNLMAPAPMAAYANARLGDVLDASDTFMSVYHLGNPIVCAALAAAQDRGRGGRDLIRAIAIGMEVGARVGAAVGPPRIRLNAEPGESPNIRPGRMPAPEIGAGVAAGSLLALAPARIRSAIGIAGANAAIHATRWGAALPMPTQKYADYGLFAQTGVTAALQAEAGMSSHPALLDGGWGLWRLRGASACDFGTMLADLGNRWYVLDNTYKPWPSCRFVHHTMTLVERLLRENSVDASSIERVDVFSHLYGIAPYFRAQDPEGMVSCEFNHPHGVAMLALGIPPGPWWYTPSTLRDSAVDAIRRRVFVQLDERSLNAEQWFVDGQIRALPSRVTIRAGGRVLDAETDFALGDPWSPETRMTDAQLRDKFLHMGSRLGAGDRAWATHARHIFDTIDRLEDVERVADLTALLGPGSLPLDLGTWQAAA